MNELIWQVQLLVSMQAVEALAVLGPQQHEVVEVACHYVAFHAARDFLRGGVEGNLFRQHRVADGRVSLQGLQNGTVGTITS